jgi:hypothetical protein
MRFGFGLALVCAFGGRLICAAPGDPADAPAYINWGALTLHPFGFIDLIGMSRSASTSDPVSTRFGHIPLGATDGQSIGSVRHSRMMLRGDWSGGGVKLTAYLEADLMNFTPGESPYHWRQYWGQMRVGRWEVLAGQAWSLLRPNRTGITSDLGMMNTNVIDPAYHVGLVGSRLRQIRAAYTGGQYKIAAAWEAGGNVVAKVARDGERTHFELSALTGRLGRRGAGASAVLGVSRRLQIVTQQFWAKRCAEEAMNVVPAGVNGLATIEGMEMRLPFGMEVYSYGGAVYGSRSADNRLVSEWTAGVDHQRAMPSLLGSLLLSVQYSRVGRAVWDGRSGSMDFVMVRARYNIT